MTYIYNNKMKRTAKWGLMLCMLALLPLQAFAEYGIDGGNTWHQQYLAKIANSELAPRSASLDDSFDKEVYKSHYHYLIKNVWDLCRLADLVNGGYEGNVNGINAEREYFRLDADIDLDGAVWYPIGVREGAPFAGYFDGNGHTVRHMNITVGDITELYGEKYGYGLFGFMKGVIHHLNMTDAQVTISQTEENQRSIFHIGLLCGYAGCATGMLINGASGAIWGCDIAGAITGKVEVALGYYTNNDIGGLVGTITSPVSIYQCHAKVNFNIENCGSVGGIVGYIENGISDGGYDGNTETAPKVSYLFDCTADVTMSLSSYQKAVKCGGICGDNDGCQIVACASSGSISCPAPSDGSYIGGIAGCNTQTIMDCVSLVSIQTAYTAGGIVGKNNFTYNTRKVAIVANCAYSGYLFGGSNAHGIAGELDNSGQKPVNCLLLGTLRKDNLNAPLWPGDDDNDFSYCDQNLYDDWRDRNEYRSFSALTSGDQLKMPFQNSATVYMDWKARLYETETSVNYSVGGEWQYLEGFYPRIQVGSSNITNGVGDLYDVRDCHIQRAANIVEESADLHTPKLFPAYAWLASVPAGIHNGLLTHHLDDVLSLADKEQNMETIGNVTKVKTATFSLPVEQTLLTVSGEKATPKENTEGGVVLTIASSDRISKQFYLNVNTSRKWDQKIARTYDAGDGTEAKPYVIHNARQLIKALTTNEAGQYYKLKNDIWFNENLVSESGGISDNVAAWSEASKNWRAHLDGDSHAIRGLYASPTISLLGAMANGSSLENTAFVDCAVKTPETGEGLSGFVGSSIADNTVVRNCLFDGLYYCAGSNYIATGGLFYDFGSSEGSNPVVEDCVVAVTTRGVTSLYALFSSSTVSSTVRRVLVLNNSQASNGLSRSETAYADSYFPAGYLSMLFSSYTKDAKPVEEMTDGTFFTGEGFDKWISQKGRFPMLKSFAGTTFGKLIALPVYTSATNGLKDMNYLLDFTPGRATWQVTSNAISIDTDIRVMEPKTASSSLWLVRTMDGERMVTPITTAAAVKTGIEFADIEAKKFCLAHYDANEDNEISLSELKNVTLEQFQSDMNEDDGNAYDNDGELIAKFPEFRYFAGVNGLGSSFQDKDKLQQVGLSANITTLNDNAFRGNSSMTTFTLPVTMTSIGAHPFDNSGLENYEVELDHDQFVTPGGVLTSKDSTLLVSYPNGRQNTSIEIPDYVKTVADNAVFKLQQVDTVFINAADYDYATVLQRSANSFVHANQGKKIVYFVEDATNDDLYAENASAREQSFGHRRVGSETTGEGNGHLINEYKEHVSWANETVEAYWVLNVSERSKDDNGYYWATMYIGWDTELPQGLTPYIVDKEKTKENEETLVLRKISNKVPMGTPVVVRAQKAGNYTLYPSKAEKWASIPMSENLLDGVNRNGMNVYQSDANDGGCLTLGLNKSGKVGFFIYKGKEKIPAFRAYISVNKVGEARNMLLEFDDEATGIEHAQGSQADAQSYNDLLGRKLNEQPKKGVYIHNRHKIIKK